MLTIIIMTNPKIISAVEPQTYIEFLEVPPMQIVPEGETYKREESLRSWIDKLAQKESSGREDIVVLDTNNRYSYSCLQFQQATFDSYSKRYSLSGDIMDCELQKEIAFRMISEKHTNYMHWQCSVIGCTKYGITGIGVPPKV